METNIRPVKVGKLASILDYDATKVVSVDIINETNGFVKLLAFKQGQKIAQHAAPGDVMIQAIEGKVEFTLDTEPQTLHAGDYMILRAGTLHSVKALTDAKFLLTKISR